METSQKNVSQPKGGKTSFGLKPLNTSAGALSSSFHQSFNVSGNNLSLNGLNLNLSSKTHTPRTRSKTPNNKTQAKLNKSGSRKTPVADRFIPDRSNFEMAHYLLQKVEIATGTADAGENDQQEQEAKKFESSYSRSLTESLLGVSDLGSTRVLSFAQKPKCPPEGYQNALKVVYQGSVTSKPSQLTKYRVIPKSPERVLDAPDVVDDFYLNILDWSKRNTVAIALKDQVYLWTAHTAEITKVPCDIQGGIEQVSSVAWVQDGNHIVCALDNGSIQIWDVDKIKLIRTIASGDTDARIPAMSMNAHLLTEGNRLGHIRHHDLRVAKHKICEIKNAHLQEICGLKWSPDARFYASGGNDNIVNIWDSMDLSNQSQPVCSFTQHVAAVKALAWSPSHHSVLATGGGTNDRTIKIWNVSSGTMLKSTDTESQVSGLVWSENYRELLSTHGFNRYQIACWKYPDMTKVGEMLGHTARILQLALSPDETTVATVAADETLRFWRVFPPTKSSGDIRKAKSKISGFQSLR